MSEIAFFSKKITFDGHSGAVYSLQYDGEFIYSASADKYVVRWDLKSGEQDKFAIKLPATPYSILLFDNNSKLITGLSTGDVHIFDILEKKELKFYKMHQKGIFSMAENPIKSHFYISDGEGMLSVWDSKSLNLLIKLPFECGKIRRITVSSDGEFIYLSSQDGVVRSLDTTYFNLISHFSAHKDGVGTLLDLDDNILVTGGKDAHIKLWNKKSNSCFKSIPAHNYMIYDIIQLNENMFISASRDKTIKIWSNELKIIQRLDTKHGGHRHSVNCIIKLNDKTFASSSDDAKIIVWETK